MKPFYPSNGTEGEGFISIWCDRCYKYNQCTILTNSLLGKKPKQWIYDEQDNAACTSFSAKRPNKTKRPIKGMKSLFETL